MEQETISDIEAAAKRVQGVAVRTPLLLQTWDPRGTLWPKPESLQPVGAFKVRGAFNAIGALDEESRSRGVIAYSSGNHAQAVAYAAQQYGAPAVIVVPDVAPRIKVEATRGYGAEVIEVPIGEHEGKAHELAAERGLTLVPPCGGAAGGAGRGAAGRGGAGDL